MSRISSEETDIIYVAVAEWFVNEENEKYKGYGLAAIKMGKRIAYVPDLSCNGEAVALLAKRCTEGRLDPVHIYDVAEDLLYEQEFN